MRSFKSNTEEMAAGFDIFGDAVREWLQDPDHEESQLESIILLLAASDKYESSVHSIHKPSAHAHRHGGSMGAYGTSQGGGAWVGAVPQLSGGLGDRYFCVISHALASRNGLGL